MRRILGLGLILVVAALPATASEHDPRFLRTDGDVIVDGLGRQVLLRGVNHIGLRSDRTHVLDPHADPADLFELGDLQDADFDAIASLGFNSVRLVVTWEFAQPDPPPAPFNEAYFALIDDAIAKAAARDMSVVFDFGQFGWSRSLGGNAGAPAWTVSPTCASMPGPQPGAPPQASASVGCAYYNFWTNAGGVQDRYLDLWRFVAARYAAEPAVSMYDLQNEPVAGPIPPGVFEYAYLYPFYRRLAAAIRAVDPNHPVAFQPQITRSIGVPSPFTEPIGIEDAIYLPHSYTAMYLPQRLDPSSLPSDEVVLAADLATLQLEADGFGAPLAIGETGWTRSTHADGVGGARYEVDPSAPPAFARLLARAADDALLGWHWFAYSSIDEAYGINHGDALDEDLAGALARPFPRATAGRLQRVSYFEDQRIYEHRILAGTAIDAPSEISVPRARLYPAGFCVILHGEVVARIDGAGSVVEAFADVAFDEHTSVLGVYPGGVRVVLYPPFGDSCEI